MARAETPRTARRRRPPGRYDEPSLLGQRVLAVLLGGMFVALVVSIVLAFYNRFATDEVRLQEIGFSVLSDDAVRVEFAVTFTASAPPDATAFCTVRARNRVGSEIGRELVEVGPAAAGSARVVVAHVLATTDRAVTGEVDGCSLQPPRGVGGP